MIRNKAYFSVIGPQGPPGLPNVPNPSTINNIAIWGDKTGITLNDSAFTLTNPFFITDSNANNLISIDYDNTTCKIAGIYDNMSSTGDYHPVYIDLDGILHTTSSANVVLMGEIYTEYSVTYSISLTLNTLVQFFMPTGFNANTHFNSFSWGQIEYIGMYTRVAFVSATISCVLNSGTNQLLTLELKVNGIKYPAASVKCLFNDNTQYQIVNLNKLISLNTNDIITMWVINASGSNNLQVYNFNLSCIVSAN
jgi:hypothetical protein